VIETAHAPIVASVGNPFVIAEVSPAALTRATPDPGGFRQAIANRPTLEGRLALHLYARDGARLRARMFAPLSGILEDPATGSANAPLAALLLSLGKETSASYEIVQGVEMGRPSLLRTTARRGADGIRATVGGSCVPVLRGEAQV
jgi:trans-2,3-dihydro-3-hydroxyanthranilate isomerase